MVPMVKSENTKAVVRRLSSWGRQQTLHPAPLYIKTNQQF